MTRPAWSPRATGIDTGGGSPRPGDDAWVEALIAAPHRALSLDEAGRVHWSERLVARLVPGSRLLLPEVRLVHLDELGAGARTRLVRRLTAFARDAVSELLGPLHGPDARALSAASRGIVYQLEQGLGTALAREARAQIDVLTDADRAALGGLGVVLGTFAVFLPRLLSRDSLVRRRSLVGAHFSPSPRAPSPGAVSIPYQESVDQRAYLALGYPVCGPRAVRADVAERVVAALSEPHESVTTQTFAHWMGCSPRAAAQVVEALTADPVGP
jgi:ATP-dependent RNA helicase SUPV3L1/SUV3